MFSSSPSSAADVDSDSFSADPGAFSSSFYGKDNEDEDEDEDDSSLYDMELFSVAPMMAHTNRHYRHFFRTYLSARAHLYTEMVPSTQVLRAYRRTRAIYLGVDVPRGSGGREELEKGPDVEEILEVARRWREDPGREYQRHGRERGDVPLLSELVGTSRCYGSSSSAAGGVASGDGEHPVSLQLGGNDPSTLAAASAIGLAFGGTVEDSINGGTSTYRAVNLNCGCPSNAVGGRNGGAALMETPDLVARCVEAMNGKMREFEDARDGLSTGGGKWRRKRAAVTVKHRLGVKDASTFDAAADRLKDDEEAYESCSAFVRAVTLGGDVTTCHVHARLGLLGEFGQEDEEDGEDDEGENGEGDKQAKKRQKLWVPGTPSPSSSAEGGTSTATRVKIDHKREQEKARRRARKATIRNRDVPPLRPAVVDRLAENFPSVGFVSNGGIKSLDDARSRIGGGGECGGVMGAMVGRAAINHPCAFAGADALWEEERRRRRRRNGNFPDGRRRSDVSGDEDRVAPTRGQVLNDYLTYCDDEEYRLLSLGASPDRIADLRRRLVAIPFHLFTGEQGNDAYQRRVRKLAYDKRRGGTLRPRSVLEGAATFVPEETLGKVVTEYTPWENVAVYEGGARRSSAMQRVVY